jgi:hypothetical protein
MAVKLILIALVIGLFLWQLKKADTWDKTKNK